MKTVKTLAIEMQLKVCMGMESYQHKISYTYVEYITTHLSPLSLMERYFLSGQNVN